MTFPPSPLKERKGRMKSKYAFKCARHVTGDAKAYSSVQVHLFDQLIIKSFYASQCEGLRSTPTIIMIRDRDQSSILSSHLIPRHDCM